MDTDLKNSIVAECSEDDVGLWEIVVEIKKQCADQVHLIKDKTIDFLRDLLSRGLIEAGYPSKTGEFKRWEIDVAQTLNRIDTEWEALGKLPDIGDIVYFTITEKGKDYLLQDGKGT